MALREEVEAHWATVETTLKRIAGEAAYDEEGAPVTRSVEEYAGAALRGAVAIGWLWGDGYRIMRENYGEIQDLVMSAEQLVTTEEGAVARVTQLVHPDNADSVAQQVRDLINDNKDPVEPDPGNG